MQVCASLYCKQQGAKGWNPTLLPLDVMLLDCFVCGLCNENRQKRLSAKDLTFGKAYYDIAIQVESAIRQQQKVKALPHIHEEKPQPFGDQPALGPGLCRLQRGVRL